MIMLTLDWRAAWKSWGAETKFSASKTFLRNPNNLNIAFLYICIALNWLQCWFCLINTASVTRETLDIDNDSQYICTLELS